MLSIISSLFQTIGSVSITQWLTLTWSIFLTIAVVYLWWKSSAIDFNFMNLATIVKMHTTTTSQPQFPSGPASPSSSSSSSDVGTASSSFCKRASGSGGGCKDEYSCCPLSISKDEIMTHCFSLQKKKEDVSVGDSAAVAATASVLEDEEDEDEERYTMGTASSFIPD
jgi:hypothetical protein